MWRKLLSESVITRLIVSGKWLDEVWGWREGRGGGGGELATPFHIRNNVKGGCITANMWRMWLSIINLRRWMVLTEVVTGAVIPLYRLSGEPTVLLFFTFRFIVIYWYGIVITMDALWFKAGTDRKTKQWILKLPFITYLLTVLFCLQYLLLTTRMNMLTGLPYF